MKEPKDISEAAEMGSPITPESAESNIRPAFSKDTHPQSAEPAEPAELKSEINLPGYAGNAGFADEIPENSPFPMLCLPADLRTIVAHYAWFAMVPESMAAATMLGAVSISLGAGIEFKSHVGKRTRANLFVLIPAQSGTGKDSIMNLAMDPLYAAETALHDEWQERDAPGIKAQLAQVDLKLKEAKKSKSIDIQELTELEAERDQLVMAGSATPIILVSDITREALSEKMVSAPGQAVASVSSEARGIISLIRGRYSSGKATDEDIYSGAWSGTPISVDRKGKASVRLTSPCLSAVWMTQPDNFREIMSDPAMVESGLLPRFLMHDPKAEPEPVPENIPVLDKGIEGAWRQLIDSLLTLRSSETPAMVIASPEALAVFREYDNETRSIRRTGGEMNDVAPFAARWAENACRVALVLHAAENGRDSDTIELSAETAKSAVEILKWFSSEMKTMFASGRWEAKQRRLDRLCELVRSNGGEVTLRDLARRHSYRREEIEALAQNSAGRLHLISKNAGPKGGAPSRVLVMTKNNA